MRVEQDRCLRASRAQVWAVVSDPKCIPRFLADVSRWDVRGEPATGLGARWDIRIDIGAAPIGGLVEVVEFDPERDLAWNSITGVSFRGRIRLRGDAPDRTEVTLRLSYQSPGGLLGLVADRMAQPLVSRALRRSLDNLEALVADRAR
jgi:uncharacterized membrane protein